MKSLTDMQEARLKVAQAAMGDLLGCSEAPEGKVDNYPFNACAWRDSFLAEYREELEEIIRFVYHNETLPPELRQKEARE